MIHHDEHSRLLAYVLVALLALLTGYILGQTDRPSAPDLTKDHWPHIVR